MADRILTFHDKDVIGAGRLGAAYYMEVDYIPLNVRIDGEKEPTDGEGLEIDIFADDVSIFANTAVSRRQLATVKGPTITHDTAKTAVALTVGANRESLVANEFVNDVLEAGTWVHCDLVNLHGGKNVTVQFELQKLGDEAE